MFIHSVIVQYNASRNDLDSEYLLTLDVAQDSNRPINRIFLTENDCIATHLPELINIGFRFYYHIRISQPVKFEGLV